MTKYKLRSNPNLFSLSQNSNRSLLVVHVKQFSCVFVIFFAPDEGFLIPIARVYIHLLDVRIVFSTKYFFMLMSNAGSHLHVIFISGVW